MSGSGVLEFWVTEDVTFWVHLSWSPDPYAPSTQEASLLRLSSMSWVSFFFEALFMQTDVKGCKVALFFLFRSMHSHMRALRRCYGGWSRPSVLLNGSHEVQRIKDASYRVPSRTGESP